MKVDLTMHLEQILTQLRAERALLDQAIANLEGLAVNRKRPRGRPRQQFGEKQSSGQTRAASGSVSDLRSLPN
jgi:hypothetical protein